jgi:chromosome segregation ATPase
MEKIKIRIDEAKTELQKKEVQTKEYKQSAEQMMEKIQQKIKEKEAVRDRLRMKANKKFSYEKELEGQQESLVTIRKNIEDLTENIKKNRQKIEELSRTLIQLTKEDQIFAKKANEMTQEKDEMQARKDQTQEEVAILSQTVEEYKKLMDSINEEIEHKIRERGQTTKNLKKAEDDDHNLYGEITYVKNKLKKLQNQVRGYQIEAQKLNKTISQLEKERFLKKAFYFKNKNIQKNF